MKKFFRIFTAWLVFPFCGAVVGGIAFPVLLYVMTAANAPAVLWGAKQSLIYFGIMGVVMAPLTQVLVALEKRRYGCVRRIVLPLFGSQYASQVHATIISSLIGTAISVVLAQQVSLSFTVQNLEVLFGIFGFGIGWSAYVFGLVVLERIFR